MTPIVLGPKQSNVPFRAARMFCWPSIGTNPRLDGGYLRLWAGLLGVRALLEKALSENRKSER
jgi:hypothetical protein